MDVAVLAGHHLGQRLAIARHAQAFGHLVRKLDAAVLVPDVARQHIGRGGALAQVVHECRPAHGQRGLQPGALVEHHHHMHAGVDFGVVLGPLGDAPEPVEFGQQHLQGAAFAQHLEHARGFAGHQAAGQLLPDALGHQVADFTVLHHPAHQRHGFIGHAEVGKPCRKARQPQDAHRVFGKGPGHMPQDLGLQVALSSIRVHDPALPGGGGGMGQRLGYRHGIDGEVAAGQVVFERHIGRGLYRKALVAPRRLAFGAGQRVFLAAVRVQKHREVLADRQVTLCGHGFGRAAHHHPVAVAHVVAHQGIAYRTADDKDVHEIP